MVKKHSIRIFAAFLAGLLLFAACKDPNNNNKPIEGIFANGVFVLNEGSLHMNNSTLAFYDFKNNTYHDDIFLEVNHRGLGDIGNDLKKYGSKLYCVVNNSNIVEILDINTAKSLKTLVLSGKQPRHIDFYRDKAYITCFDGDLIKIDTSTMKVEATVHTGPNPDDLCICNGKIYVANSGGLNYPNYGNTISVVDPQTFTVLKDITVTINPTRIKAYENNAVYVVSNGNYGDIPYDFQKIDCSTDELVKRFDLEVLNFDIYQNLAYIYMYNYNTQSSWIKVLNLDSEEIVDEQFIKDGTVIKIPYGIKVNPLNNDVWITDAINFSVNGDVYCFDKNGNKKFSFSAGMNPSSLVFIQ